MILAFFVPSVQEQWDRYEARKVVQQYEEIGDDLFNEARYEMAEQSYAKAFALSEDKRLDIEVKRLSAKVSRISNDPAWGSKSPEDLHDIDFQLLLHLEKDRKAKRVGILNSYGIYLSSLGRIKDAEAAFEEAVIIDPEDELAYVNMGNLLDQLGRKKDAEEAYRKAIAIEPGNARSHYNLGLLFEEENRLDEALAELTRANELDPDDIDARIQLDSVLKRIKK